MSLGFGRVFLSYASEDRARILRLYDNLKTAGFSPWIDTRDIPKGSDWDQAIRDAIRESRVFVACISRASASKGGVLAGEIDSALAARKGHKVLFIPVRLDDTPVPEKLSHIQWVDLKDDESWREVAAVIRAEERRVTRRNWLASAGVALPLAAIGSYLYWKLRRPHGETLLAVNLLRVRPARAEDPAATRFTMNPTPNNGLKSPTVMCTEQMALGQEISETDLVLLRVRSSQSGYLYVIDQELSPEPGRPVVLADGLSLRAAATFDVPPSSAGTISYFRFDQTGAAYIGEQLTVLVVRDRLPARIENTGGVPVMNSADWERVQREYPVTDGAPGEGFAPRLLPVEEGSKEIRVETASATYRGASTGTGSHAAARIVLRVRPR